MNVISENLLKAQTEKEEPDDNYRERIAHFDKMLEDLENKERQPTTVAIEEKIVAELNKTHAVVHTDQFYILTEKKHPHFEGIDFTLESKQSFLNMYKNQIVDFERNKPRSKAKIWLTHANRRQYYGITFDPTTTTHKHGLYNIWKGFAIQPKQGDCSLIKKHLEHVICNANQEYFFYIWKWMAHLVQRPVKLLPALLLMSEQGSGKNTLVDTLGLIFGQHYLPLDSEDLQKTQFVVLNLDTIHRYL